MATQGKVDCNDSACALQEFAELEVSSMGQLAAKHLVK